MARIRSIKPGFFTDDQLSELKVLARLLFIGLWCVSDREGRVNDRPRKLKAEILPFDKANVDGLLDDLAKAGFILRYEREGARFIQVVNFTRHQFPNKKEGASTIPAPDEHDTRTKQAPDEQGGNMVNGNGNMVEGNMVEGDARGGAEDRPPPANAFGLYEKAFGEPIPNEVVAEKLLDAEREYGEECLKHCLEAAALADVRDWRYVEKVLKRHKREGCADRQPASGPALAPTNEHTAFLAKRYEAGKGKDVRGGA